MDSLLIRAACLAVLACCATSTLARDAVFVYSDGDDSVLLTNLAETGRTALFTVAIYAEDDAATRLRSLGPRMAPPEVARLVDAVAPASGLEPQLLLAVISAESGFRARAVSPKGAQGLMQLMPATARRLGVSDPFDPEQNVRGGARYLVELLRLFNDDLRLALAAYNAGENAVLRAGRSIPPYPETRQYVARVMERYQALRSL
ncbi:MAG: lytic transglycosylase domain-containing protein [Burkholderiaceae bacterium]